MSFSLGVGLCPCLVTANPSPLLGVSQCSVYFLTPAIPGVHGLELPLVIEQLWLQPSPTPEKGYHEYLGVRFAFS